MRPEITLCVSQQMNEQPYLFKVTGLHVYSFEEVLYHVYHYWKQSVDDFLSDELIAWVNDTLGLSFLAARMKEIARGPSFGRKLTSFLGLIDYFNDEDLESLNAELLQWEKRLEWEKLKERADYLMGRAEPDKALVLYRRALQFEENAALYNNLGVALMQTEDYEAAYRNLKRASELEPENTALPLALAEAALYGHRFDEARVWLEQASARTPSHPDIPFLHGALCHEQGDYTQAIAYYEKAVAAGENPEPLYLYRLADVYAGMRQYDHALAVLDRAAERDVALMLKQAELHAAAGNMPAAAKSIRQAIAQRGNDAGLWVKLAMYHRLDYDFNAADTAVTKALAIDPENERARLENARIKKAMGRTREYQTVLNGVLRDFRQKYREFC